MTDLLSYTTTTSTPDTIAHVRAAVSLHGFTDSCDWAIGLAELATLGDAEIDAIVSDDDYPPVPLDKLSPRFLVSQRKRYGITSRQTAADILLLARVRSGRVL